MDADSFIWTVSMWTVSMWTVSIWIAKSRDRGGRRCQTRQIVVKKQLPNLWISLAKKH